MTRLVNNTMQMCAQIENAIESHTDHRYYGQTAILMRSFIPNIMQPNIDNYITLPANHIPVIETADNLLQ